MEIRRGIPVSPGIVIRQAFVLDSEDFRIPRRFAADKKIEGEVERFKDAVKSAEREITNIREDLVRTATEVAPIFEAHLRMLLDPQMHDDVVKQIRASGFTAEYAVSRVFLQYGKTMKAIRDPYFAERVVDLFDIQKRLQRTLLGAQREDLSHLSEEVVLVAHELTPSQTALLDRTKVLGIALDVGGRTSHTSIMTRALGIPAVVGLETITSDVSGGQTIVIDGNRGVVIIEPDATTLQRYQDAESKYHDFSLSLLKYRHLPAKTTDGVRINLLANIEFPWEIKGAIENGASGIGLYRTEFLYAEAAKEVSEDEHYETYKKAMEEVDGHELVIRSLDLGADKFAPMDRDNRAVEKNPFLGCRSIRLCLENPDFFKVQLRAILRASALGHNLKLMLPMVSSLEELRQAKLVIADTREELDKRGVAYNKNLEVGVMIEIPSAALISDFMAPEVDFFSIGTNDLIQYALAVDRGNERVATLYKPAHPAVLRLINTVIKAGKNAGIKVAMCGEMSGDVMFTILLVGLGLQDLSTAPSVIPEIKQIIRSISAKEAKQIARRALKFQTSEEAIDYLIEKTRKILPEVY